MSAQGEGDNEFGLAEELQAQEDQGADLREVGEEPAEQQADDPYAHYNSSDLQADYNRHATRIQSMQRGRTVRRSLKDLSRDEKDADRNLNPPAPGADPNLPARPAQELLAPSAPRSYPEDYNRHATKIQSQYRGHALRKSLSPRKQPTTNPKPQPESEPVKLPDSRDKFGITAESDHSYSNVMPPSASQENQPKLENEHSLRDQQIAATRIQAQFRGCLGRKSSSELRRTRERDFEEQRERQMDYLKSRQTAERVAGRPVPDLPEEIQDPGPPQFDAEAAQKATRIQATYRGHRSRKKSPSPKKKKVAIQDSRAHDDIVEQGSPDASDDRDDSRSEAALGRSGDLGSMRPAAIDIGPEPATETPDGTPKGLQKLQYDPHQVQATSYGTGVIVKNQGTLRSSIMFDDPGKAGVASWEQYFRLQRKKVVPLPGGDRRMLDATEFYRLRILCLRDVPMYVSEDRVFEFQVNVTLFDELAGQFYGSTACSPTAPYAWVNAQDTGQGVTVDLAYDMYFHSTTSDPGCIAIAEVVMVERMYDGVVCGEYSVGWAGLPLYRHDEGHRPGQQILETRWVDVTAGTPRYLLFRDLFDGRPTEPPMPLGVSRLGYQFTAYPLLLPAAPLLPANNLVSYTAAIPGLQRFDINGFLTTSGKNITSTLARPLLSPSFAISLYKLAIALPAGFQDLLTLDTPNSLMKSSPPQMTEYELRLSAHNGRTFVGPEVTSSCIKFVKMPSGGFVLEGEEALELDWLPGDVNIVLIVELVYIGPSLVRPQMLGDDNTNRKVVVGWAPICPFKSISPLDSTRVDEGDFTVHLRSGPGYWVRDVPLLDWKGMMESRTKTSPPPIEVHFSLGLSGREAILPPLPLPVHAVENVRNTGEFDYQLDPDEDLVRTATMPEIAQLAGRTMGDFQDELEDPTQSVSPTRKVPQKRTMGMRMPDLSSVATSQQALALLGQQDRLTRLAETMQTQLNQMNGALKELQKGRTSIQDFGEEGDTMAHHAAQRRMKRKQRERAATTIQRQYRQHSMTKRTAQRREEVDFDRYTTMKTTAPGDTSKFAGGTAAPESGPMAPPRWLRARLHDAGATDALPPEVRTLMRRRGDSNVLPGPVDLDIEARDARLVSDVVVQMLAYRHAPSLNAPAKLRNSYFTFQLYDFPPTISEVARLKPSGEGESQVFFLHRHAQSTSADAYPGLLMKYSVGGENILMESSGLGGSAQPSPHQRRMDFCTYLATHHLSVDVWDGDSLLQIGTASVDLKPLLRQGRDFAEVLLEVPVFDHEEAAPEIFQRNRRDRKTAVARGFLMLRAINIGRVSDDESRDTLRAGRSGATMGGGKLGFTVRSNRVRVKAVPDKGGVVARELIVPSPAPAQGGRRRITEDEENLWSTGDVRMATTIKPAWGGSLNQTDNAAMRQRLTDMEGRKLARQARLRELKANRRPPSEDRFEDIEAVRGQLLADLDASRNRVKKDVIRRQLWRHLATRRIITPAFGEAVLFEHEFHNPQESEVVFHLHVSHPDELIVVRDALEWKGLRVHCNHRASGGGVSHGSRALESDVLDGDRLYLGASERLAVPFKFQSYRTPDHMSEAHRMPLIEAGNTMRSPIKNIQRVASDPAEPYVITVELRAEGEERPVSILEVQVCPRGLVVDRTFRFHQPERERMRQVVRVPLLPGLSAALLGGDMDADGWQTSEAEAKQLQVACSDEQVVCGTQASHSGGENDEVVLKFKGGPAPETRQLFVAVYRDRWCCRPLETWQVFIHSLKRVDLSAMVGQTCEGSVVVRGKGSTRRVRCYTSHPDELQMAPDSFTLVSGALSEVRLLFRPVTGGKLDVLAHVVDTETRELVQALIVSTTSQAPMITKTFEVEVQAGSTLNKKISYTNPYNSERSFFLKASQPWLVHFRPGRLDLPGGAKRHVGLTFDARNASIGSETVLIFINDEDDKNEECFKVKVRVVGN